MTRICKQCLVEKPLDRFYRYGRAEHNRRRVCGECWTARKHDINHVPKERRWVPQPLNIEGLYRRGTRCWCCRRNSAGQMLCKTCRGAA